MLHMRLLLSALLLFLLLSSSSFLRFLFSPSPSSPHLLPTTTTFPLHLSHLQPLPPSPIPTSSIILPDSQLLLILPSHSRPLPPLLCLFPSGATTPSSPAGLLPSSLRPLLRCPIPTSLLRLKRHQIPSPLLIHQHYPRPDPNLKHQPSSEAFNWNYLVYESTSTPSDVILFAKGINNRQGSSRPPSDLRCVFYDHGSPVARTVVTSSVQEVFRCLHPSGIHFSSADVKVSLEVAGHALPSVSLYPPPPVTAHDKGTSLICACTMVHNVSKFLPEWVKYHSRVGVDRFVLYDNGSEDELEPVLAKLRVEGHDVETYLWPWPKTQEAGFSHAAAVHRGSCEWMMYLDVDEFVYSPKWVNSTQPEPGMLRSLLPAKPDRVGQVTVDCRDFGPSGLREHPKEGVTQGYICRRKATERHKSLVRLDAVHESLMNVVHHFKLENGFETMKLRMDRAVVNHYKYQAWSEFRNKFKRRVSAYVADWTRAANAGSKDRTPGLGFEAVEPEDWPERFCEVRDTGLMELNRRWFSRAGPDGSSRMAWEM